MEAGRQTARQVAQARNKFGVSLGEFDAGGYLSVAAAVTMKSLMCLNFYHRFCALPWSVGCARPSAQATGRVMSPDVSTFRIANAQLRPRFWHSVTDQFLNQLNSRGFVLDEDRLRIEASACSRTAFFSAG